jgi:hypothetical protein
MKTIKILLAGLSLACSVQAFAHSGVALGCAQITDTYYECTAYSDEQGSFTFSAGSNLSMVQFSAETVGVSCNVPQGGDAIQVTHVNNNNESASSSTWLSCDYSPL